MATGREDDKNSLDDTYRNAAVYHRHVCDCNDEDAAATPFEFLKQQLSAGEITLNEYMMICQALSS